jgi:hypothetical protein
MKSFNRLFYAIVFPWTNYEMHFWGALLAPLVGAAAGKVFGGGKEADRSSKAQAGYYNKLGNIADEQFSTWLNTYAPLEKEVVAGAREGIKADYEGVTSRASADVMQAFSKARGVTLRNRERYGLNPADGRFQGVDRGLEVAQASADAGAVNSAREGERRYVDDTNFNRRYAVANLGRGLLNGATAGTAAASQSAGQNAYLNGNGASGLSSLVAGLPWGKLSMPNFGSQPSNARQPDGDSNGGDGFGIPNDYRTPNWGPRYEHGGEIRAGLPGLTIDHATGKEIVGGDGTVDSVPGAVRRPDGGLEPAMFDEGEMVIPRNVVEWEGKKNIYKMINNANQAQSKGLPMPAAVGG